MRVFSVLSSCQGARFSFVLSLSIRTFISFIELRICLHWLFVSCKQHLETWVGPSCLIICSSYQSCHHVVQSSDWIKNKNKSEASGTNMRLLQPSNQRSRKLTLVFSSTSRFILQDFSLTCFRFPLSSLCHLLICLSIALVGVIIRGVQWSWCCNTFLKTHTAATNCWYLFFRSHLQNELHFHLNIYFFLHIFKHQ